LFHKTTIEATNGILHNAGLIKSIKFPGESVIISIVLRNLFEHLFEIIVFAIFLSAFNVSLVGIIFYLIVLVFLILFSYGVSLILSALTIYFIDLKNIWTFISRLLWFATPIFYSIGGQTKLLTFSMFNPLYYFITISRDIIIYQRMPELWMIGGAVIFTVAALAIGIFVFHLLRHKFAEMI
jgi:ABC-type polysaccharide/polyol phosphate export permease